MNGADGSSSAQIDELQARLGYRFRSPDLLNQALTHSSYPRGAKAQIEANERLEFVGDRVLGLAIAHLLYQRFPAETVGELARRHAALVRRDALFAVAQRLELAPLLRLSRGEDECGGRSNPGLVADACEAVIAAVYWDGGLHPALDVVERLWRELIESDRTAPKDAKTALQEWAQGVGLAPPVYREVARSGPPHAPTFTVEVVIAGSPPVMASGASKRAAERGAAEAMLARLDAGRRSEGQGRDDGPGAS